jgi:PHP family Zn ribbon phosphoesterase
MVVFLVCFLQVLDLQEAEFYQIFEYLVSAFISKQNRHVISDLGLDPLLHSLTQERLRKCQHAFSACKFKLQNLFS